MVMKKWLKLFLKLLNYSIGMGGIAITIYGVLLIRAWQPDDYQDEGSSYQDFDFPWFFHAFLGVGVAMCAITSLGHIAANTANSYCLSSYITVVLLLLVSETAYVFLNPKWVKELPSEKFDDFKDFLESNDETCKGLASFIILIQGLCILLAAILRTHDADEADNYDDEDEHVQPNSPLMGRPSQWAVADSNIV